MTDEHNHTKARLRSCGLVLLMLLSTLASLDLAGAAVSRTYTTHYNPTDIAIADFDCDGFKDMAIATDFSHRITVLWNDGEGDFTNRTDIWVSNADRRSADWTDIAFADRVEIKENADGPPDIVIWQANLPFNNPPQPGNITIIENTGCGSRDFNIGERFTHFYVWDMKVGDFDGDGNGDIAVLELASDITTQNMVVYMGPNPNFAASQLTTLGQSTAFSFRSFSIGNIGEALSTIPGTGELTPGECEDLDIFFLRSEGVDYATGRSTNPGNDDNITVMEFDCPSRRFPIDATTQSGGASTNNPVEAKLDTIYGGMDIADIDEDGYIDTLAMTDENTENITFVTRTGTGPWSAVQKEYFGPYVAFSVTIADMNNDDKADFVVPTLFEGFESRSSSGQQFQSYYFNTLSTIQVILSSATGYQQPLSYDVGTRASFATVEQFVGSPSSAPDVVVGYADYAWGNPFYWAESRGWEGQWDHITIIEMDFKDLAVADIEVGPTDRYYGILGEGTRDVNITLVNGGMEQLSGTFDLDITIEGIDEASSTNSTVYANNFDGSEETSGCGIGCTWTSQEYLPEESINWHINNETIIGAEDEGDERFNNSYQANWEGNNPTNFQWSSTKSENSTGGEWTGYEQNWDEAVILNGVDLTGADRAWMSVDLFGSFDYTGLGNSANGFYSMYWVYDDTGFIEIRTDDAGWQRISCPFISVIDGFCPGGVAQWGGFDNNRVLDMILNGAPERFSPGTASGFYSGTHYGWQEYTAEGLGQFDLSNWAGEIVDLRFRFRSGFQGSVGYENETYWTGMDGFAFDDITITKQETVFTSGFSRNNPVTVNNLMPGEEIIETIQFDFENDATYKISVEITPDPAWTGEQPINNLMRDFVSTFNLYDPAVVDIDFFADGGLYAEGELPMKATVAHYGNTKVNFSVEASILSALPSRLQCGVDGKDCIETFENPQNFVHIDDDNDGRGDVIDDSMQPTPVMGSNAYWFGHPDVTETSALGYDDQWNENLSITNIDLTNMQGTYAALSFEYYADTHYYISPNGSYYNFEDNLQLMIEWEKQGRRYTGIIYGQYNDFNGDERCSSNEIDYVGDVVDPNTGRERQFIFNSNGEVKSSSVDFTHIYLLNTSVAIGGYYYTECISLAGANDIDIKFHFESNNDGYNGVNNGYLGVAVDNITVKEFSFIEDMVYTEQVTDLDAGEERILDFGLHDFGPGVYRLEVTTIFDNQTAGTNWYGEQEMFTSNNKSRVTFNVESVDIFINTPNILGCVGDNQYKCLYPIDEIGNHEFKARAINGVLAGNYVFNLEVMETATGTMVFNQSTTQSYDLEPGEVTMIDFPIFTGWEDGKEYRVGFVGYVTGQGKSGNDPNFTATFSNQIDVLLLSDDVAGHLPNIKEDLKSVGLTYTQFSMARDWDSYLTADWVATSAKGGNGFQKVLMPWQSEATAQVYYETIGLSKQLLEGFMTSGGTVEMHLGPYQQYYTSATGGRLPLGLSVLNRVNPDAEQNDAPVQYDDMLVGEQFHPLLNGVDETTMAGWNPYDSTGDGTVDSYMVADAVLQTQTLTDSSATMRGALYTTPAGNCRDSMRGDGAFQNILQHHLSDTRYDSLLATCSVGDGGMIATTLDVEADSGRHDSATMPLLANMLGYMVREYADFGTFGSTMGLEVNSEEPCGRLNLIVCNDPSTVSMESDYTDYPMKSDQNLNLSYFAGVESLEAYWVLDGPTDWDDVRIDVTNTDPMLVRQAQTTSVSLCSENTLDASFPCEQGVEWTVSLYIYNILGQGRKLTIDLVTDDVLADFEEPEAESEIVWSEDKTDNTSVLWSGWKPRPAAEFEDDPPDCDEVPYQVALIYCYPTYQITLPEPIVTETGEEIQPGVRVYFDSSNSTDPDWSGAGSGVQYYEWILTGDYDPLTTTTFQIPHVYGSIESPDDLSNNIVSTSWSYLFKNSTVQAGGSTFQEIKVDLVVYDQAMNPSDKYRMYFTVVPAGMQDDPPDVEEDVSCGVEKSNPCTLDDSTDSDDYVEITGTVLGGIEDGDMKVEAALMDISALSDPDKASMKGEETYAAEISLSDGDQFTLRLRISEQYGDPGSSNLVTIYIRIDEGRGDHVIYKEISITLKNNLAGIDDGPGGSGNVSDSGVEGGPATNMIYAGAGIVALLLVLIITVMLVRSRAKVEDDDGFGGSIGEMDIVEQYVQQLVSQGYPEETARVYAQAYAAQAIASGASGAGGALPAAAAATTSTTPTALASQVTTNPKMEAYVQQLMAQGYPENTARQHAMQYAERFK